jgi:hypothetical protein
MCAVKGWANGLIMGGSGFAYIPSGCGCGSASCRLSVALHVSRVTTPWAQSSLRGRNLTGTPTSTT